MSEEAEAPPPAAAEPLRLLFIHHSCGGQLLAEPGEKVGGDTASQGRCIYASHPNGGGLRRQLVAAGYEVHEASYGSRVGEETDIHHWSSKFQNLMDEILLCDRQDRPYTSGQRNRIVAFKSCYPNNGFLSRGEEPGDPHDSALTVANAKAAYNSLLPLFAARPEVLFVAFTAPPQVRPRPVGFWQKLRAFLKGEPPAARLAREFNTWLAVREGGWLADYRLPNVVVFDYYNVLTGHGTTDWSAYPTRGGRDSHPSSEGNRLAAGEFVPFLNAAVAGMRHRPGDASRN